MPTHQYQSHASTESLSPEVLAHFVYTPPQFPDRKKEASVAQAEDKRKLDEYIAQKAAQAAREAEAAKAVPVSAPTPQASPGPSILSDAAINALGACESGNTANRNSGNGFYGAFQFTISTWNAMGTGYARADLAPYDVQAAAVQRLLSQSSIFSQFPACGRKLAAQGLI